MSSSQDDLRSWTQRQWSAMVAALLLGQLALILAFAEREPSPSERLAADVGLQAVGWPVSVTNTTRQLGVSDPLLFALPSGGGFSGEAWRLASAPPAPRVEWSEPIRWLTGKSEWFSGDESSSRLALGTPQRSLDRPVPGLTALHVRPLPVARRTRLELDQRLSARGLHSKPALPEIAHTNLLDATVLRVAVEPDGTLFSAVVLKSSGWEVADQKALDLVRQVRFSPQNNIPLPSNDRQWGRVHVRWHTARPGSPDLGE
jgi:TonB family protein